MTSVPMMAFRCDRCLQVIHVDTNSQPAMERGKPPTGWGTLIIGAATNPASHLCPTCNSALGNFFQDGAPSND